MFLNRKTSDGNLIEFRKDNTVVGSIGTFGSALYIASPDGTDAGLRVGNSTVVPVTTTGGLRDNAIDLGSASARFKDLYLSGKITNDGTGGINIDTAGNVGIGISNPDDKLHVADSSNAELKLQTDNANGGSVVKFNRSGTDNSYIGTKGYFLGNSDNNLYLRANSGLGIEFYTNGNNERMRINSDGNVLIGRTSELFDFGEGRTSLVLQGTGSQDYATIQIGNNGTASDTQILGILAFYDGTENNARVQARRASSTDSADLLFFTRPASGSLQQRLQIDSSGNVLINTTSSSTQQGIFFGNNGQTLLKRGTGGDVIFFVNSGDGSEVGKITILQSSTVYATSSDYRLKESITYDFDATTRLKQLKPCRFNFISDETNTLVDGFLAHEAQAVVPECVTGKKDGVKVWVDGDELPDGVSVGDNKLDADGNTIPDYQGIDQSKLVPLLVKTIQELEARITALETA
jgi:hypothetical protein